MRRAASQTTMAQGLLRAHVGFQQCACDQQLHTPSVNTTRRHGRPHAFSSSSLTSKQGAFAGQTLQARCSHSVRQRSAYTSASVLCQAATEKMVIAVTGECQTVLQVFQHRQTLHVLIYCITFTGATGLVGSKLVSRLSAQGHTVRILTRNTDKARSKLPYARLQFFNIQRQLADALKGATGVVNLAGLCSGLLASSVLLSPLLRGILTEIKQSMPCLHYNSETYFGLRFAGEPIATRWSASLKREIKESRVATTANLAVSPDALSYVMFV